MAIKTEAKKFHLEIPLTLVLVGSVASHLPVLAFDRLAPLHVIQVLVIGWTGYAALASRPLRANFTATIRRYWPIGAGIFALLIWSGLSLLWGELGSVGHYKFLLLEVGVAFGTAILLLLCLLKPSAKQWMRLVIYAGVALAAFCVWQFIGDNLDAPHWLTQIVPGGHWDQIDFSRANGLAEEPQFLTTLLLLPVSLLYFLADKRTGWKHWLGFFLLDLAVLLSLSRGGFLAYGLIGVGWLVYWLAKSRWQQVLIRVSMGVLALLAALSLIAWSGTLAGHRGGEWAARRYVEQATGGLLPLHTDYVKELQQQAASPVPVAVQSTDEPTSDNSPTGRDEVGVVEESTLSRLDTYRQARDIWAESPQHAVVGVGYGSVGDELATRYHAGYSNKSIINNQPLQIGVELGIVGVAIILYIVWQLVRFFRSSRAELSLKLCFAVLLLAMAIQLQFYSALHLPQIWLVLALCMYCLHTRPKIA